MIGLGITTFHTCCAVASLDRVPASAGVKAGMSPLPGGTQVTLCDPIWYVSSRSGVGGPACKLLYAYFTFYFYKLMEVEFCLAPREWLDACSKTAVK